MIKQIIYNYCGLLSVLWAILIFVLCATPGQYLPSEKWLELIAFDKALMAIVLANPGKPSNKTCPFVKRPKSKRSIICS